MARRTGVGARNALPHKSRDVATSTFAAGTGHVLRTPARSTRQGARRPPELLPPARVCRYWTEYVNDTNQVRPIGSYASAATFVPVFPYCENWVNNGGCLSNTLFKPSRTV